MVRKKEEVESIRYTKYNHKLWSIVYVINIVFFMFVLYSIFTNSGTDMIPNDLEDATVLLIGEMVYSILATCSLLGLFVIPLIWYDTKTNEWADMICDNCKYYHLVKHIDETTKEIVEMSRCHKFISRGFASIISKNKSVLKAEFEEVPGHAMFLQNNKACEYFKINKR